jgi:hypothetical protein
MGRGGTVTNEMQRPDSEKQRPDAVSLPVTAGTDDEILAALWQLAYASPPGSYNDAVYAAIRHIQEGGRAVQVPGERFVVAEPEWSIEQFVFGCEKGRECTDVTEEQQQQFKALIAARLAAGEGTERVKPEAQDDKSQPSTPEPEG